jgi:hypothetical protein
VVGNLGLGGAMAGAIDRATQEVNHPAPAPVSHRAAPVKRAAPREDRGVEIYHGTKVEEVKVGA